MSRKLWLGVGTALAVGLAGSAAIAAGIPLATYRAVHDMKLDDASSGSSGRIVGGRLVTEFTGSPCVGYTTKTRFVTDGVDAQGTAVTDDQRTTTVETPDGRFRFTNETYIGEVLSERVVGVAQRGSDAITVDLSEPAKGTFTIAPETAFPTEQTQRVIEAAVAGEHFVSFDVYDGSNDGRTILSSAAVIGAPLSADESGIDSAAVAAAGYIGIRRWPVTVSYFDTGKGADERPFFVLSAVVYENGLLADLRMDYGSFSLTGTITHLEALPAAACPG